MNPFKRLFQKEKEEVKEPQEGSKLLSFDSLLYGGRGGVFEYYNPDDLLIKKGNEIYEAMLNDDQVKAVLAFKKAAVISRGYYFEKEVGNEDHERIADFFKEVIEKMNGSFSSKLKGMLSAYSNGFYIGEKIWDNIEFDGKTYWTVIDIRKKPFSSFQFKVDPYGNIIDLVQTNGAKEQKVPMEKVIHFVYQPDENEYYGKSDLRSCYRSYWSKDVIIKFQNIHIERHASGLPVISAREGASTDREIKESIKKMLRRITTGTGFYLPKGYEMEVHSPQSTDAYEKAIAQHDKAIAKSVLVPNLLGLSEQGQTGSYSQSQTQFDSFIWIIDADTADLCEALNEQLWKPLAEVNFGTDDYPKMNMGELTRGQKESLAKLWNELVKGNAVTNTEEDEAYTRELLGYPEKPEDLASEEDDPPVIDDSLLPDSINPLDPALMIAFQERSWLRRVNFKAIEKTFNKNEPILVEDLNAIMGRIRLSLEKQIMKITGDRQTLGTVQLKEYDALVIPKKELSNISKTIRDNLNVVFNSNYVRASKELPKKQFANLVGMDKTRADKFLSQKSLQIKDIIEADVLKSVKTVLSNSIKYDKSMKATIQELDTDTKVRELLPEVDAAGRTINVASRLENIARTNTAEAINQGRMSLFGDASLKGFVRAYEYSAVLDGRVTDICSTLHGQVKRTWDNYLPPNHYQCRSVLVAVTEVDDWDEKEYNIPTRIKPHQGFG